MDNIFTRDKEYVLNLYKRNNLHIVSGEGSYLYDESGNKYLDMFSGIAVNSLGQNNESIKKAVIKQLDQYAHLSNFFVSDPVVNLAQLLVENSTASKVYFSNSGTEANEAAIKLARKYGRSIDREKTEIITFYNSFHGRTIGGMTLTGQEKYKESFAPVLPDVSHVVFDDFDDMKNQVSNKTCAVFIEMIQGEGGIRELSQSYIEKLTALAKEYNFLIVVDEIQTGLSRTGELFAHEYYGLTPDLVTTAKALGGGLPLGALLVSNNLENVLEPGDHGSTFGGNPLACAAGEVVLETITQEGFQQGVKDKGAYLVERLEHLQANYPDVIKDIRGRGLMLGVDVGDSANTIKERAFAKGLLLNVTSGSVLRLLPPLTIDYAEIDEFIEKMQLLIDEL